MSESIVVLHVDDEPDIADLSAEFLERQDDRIEVVTETNAEDGLSHLQNGDVDCIVSDYDMPRTDGLEFLEAVRDRHPDRPFILFTGKGSEEVASEALSKGATDYLQKKPGAEQYEILANRVLNYVETARSEAQRRRQLDAIETAEEGISILDENGEFVYVNRAYADLYGYEPEEIVGESWEFLYPEEEIERVAEEIQQQLREEGTWRGETVGLRADGSTFIEDHTLSRTDRGEMICTVRDVTERRERKRELERYRTILEAMGDGVYALDADGNVTHANDVLLDMLGYDFEELVETDLAEIYDSEDRRRFQDAIESLYRSEESGVRTVRATAHTADGDELPIEVTLTLLPTDDGEYRGSVGVVRDVSERRRREQELEQYRTIVEAMGDGVYALDHAGRVIHVNDVVLDLVGYDYEEFVNTEMSQFFDEADVDRFEAAIADLIENDDQDIATVTATATVADGREIPIEVSLTLLPTENGEFRGTVGVVRDISDRKRRHDTLRRYRNAFESAQSALALADENHELTVVNPAFLELWGYDDPKAVQGRHLAEFWTDPDAATEVLDQVAAVGEWAGELEAEAGDGSTFTVECAASRMTDENDNVTGIIASFLDVSERVQREAELERYETLLELMPDTVVVTDLDGRLQEIHGFEGWAGYDREELIGSHMSKTTSDEVVEEAENLVADMILSEERSKATFEYLIETKDGELIPFENHITLLPPDENGEIQGTMSVLRDISERTERERELRRQNERLEEFAGIVSHDLRNPLNVAGAHLELAGDECDSEHLESVAGALERMETLIDDLLALSRERQPVEDYETVTIGDVTRGCWEIVETGDATLEIDADRQIRADESRLKQLLENLLRNAVEHGGPDVTVLVGTLEDESGFFVADDGPGIPPEKREQVFESGYSTTDGGTGFGLSIVKEVANAHGWDVSVTESEAGGARFELRWTDRRE